MTTDPNHLVLFLGRFHPLLVHLPIGGLVLLGLLELMGAATRWKDAAQNNRWILGFVSAAACFSAVCGWLLAEGGGYPRQLLKWHRAAGLAVTAACFISLLLLRRGQLRAYRISLLTTLLLLGLGSHLGGSLTHGSDFLTRYAPAPLRFWLRDSAAGPANAPATGQTNQHPVFARIIQPILQDRCSACHAGEKHKGGLRLDSLEALLQGGRDGPVVKFGRAQESPLIQRLLLPLDGDGRMPPEDQPQPTAEEIALLELWINAVPPAPQRVDERNPPAENPRSVETVSQEPAAAK